MAAHRSGLDGTRDVDLHPAEQQDRLGEQLGSLPGGGGRPSPTLEHGEKRVQSSGTLVRLRSGTEQGRQVLARERGASPTDEDPEANQEAARRGRTADQDGSMPVEQHQIERALDQSSDPFANASPRDFVAAGHLRDRLALMDFFHRPQDVPYVVDLARKQLEGQHALARPTSLAPCQPHPDPPITRGRLRPPLHPALGQDELIAAASGADTTRKNRLVRAGQNLGVAGTIHDKYVDQTAYLEDGSGDCDNNVRGRRLFWMYSGISIVAAGRIRTEGGQRLWDAILKERGSRQSPLRSRRVWQGLNPQGWW